MALRNIFKEGESVLRRVAREVTMFDNRLHVLIDDMWETMYKADGVGLAAPQVGIAKRVAVVDIGDGEKLELVNPVISKRKGEQVGLEGCLSIDSSKNGNVIRPMSLVVNALDRNGNPFEYKAEGFKARAICHECDHLDGILFIDKVIKA